MFFTWLNEERSLFSFYLFFLTYILKLLFCFLFFFKINYTKKLSIFKFKLTNGINFNSDLIDCIYYGILYINKILIFKIIFCPLLFYGFVNLRWINWMSSCKKKRQTQCILANTFFSSKYNLFIRFMIEPFCKHGDWINKI